MKKLAGIICLAATLGLSILAVLPHEILGGEEGNEKKGKFYNKETCRTCHGPEGEAGELQPISKTMAQWEEYFDEGKHNNGLLKDVVDEEKLIHIKTFLIKHAADSDHPETCG